VSGEYGPVHDDNQAKGRSSLGRVHAE